jgi:hypothetical protein
MAMPGGESNRRRITYDDASWRSVAAGTTDGSNRPRGSLDYGPRYDREIERSAAAPLSTFRGHHEWWRTGGLHVPTMYQDSGKRRGTRGTRGISATGAEQGGCRSGRGAGNPDHIAHNPKVVGSNPTPATKESPGRSQGLPGPSPFSGAQRGQVSSLCHVRSRFIVDMSAPVAVFQFGDWLR